MKRLLLFFALLFPMFGNADTPPSKFEAMLDGLLDGNVPQISPDDLSQMMEKEKNQFVLLDARKKIEYEVSHLLGAEWIGYPDTNFSLLKKVPKDKKIVVYCSVGKRSEIVGKELLELGYKDVSNLRGGLFLWANEGRILVNRTSETKDVHPFSQKWGRWLNPEIPKKKKP
ncbi:MAG: hypothetical protein CMO55_28830 [Verrucomicrobiales bacterium]|nr:hypothetical protein [Verrucomicrobiales bacterium]